MVLLKGNCLELMKDFRDNSVDYSLTSPPYNRKRNDKYSKFDDINNDWLGMNIEVINQLLRITKNHVFYNLQTNCYNRKDVYNLIGRFSDKIQNIFIWEKSNPMPAAGKSITNAFEYFFILGETSLKSNTTYTKNILTTSVNSNMPKDHKAVMKQEVADHFIDKFTKKYDLIFDPFMGLGTTGIACKKLDRNFTGIELVETYFNKAKENLTN